MISRAALRIAAAVLLAAGTLAMPMIPLPVTDEFDMDSVSHVANFQDVPHTFTSQYKFSADCPDQITMKNVKIDNAKNVGTVQLSDISETSGSMTSTCVGTDTTNMKLVSEATVKQQGLLTRLGFLKAAAGITSNPAAKATVDNSKKDSSLLVGFDEGSRKCGGSIYADSSFFFFIREPAMFKITITTGVGSRTSIAIPPNTRSLFVTGQGNKICLLTDVTTSQGRQVTVTSTAPGVSEPVVVVQSVTPTPSASASVTPTVNPSSTPIPSAIPSPSASVVSGILIPTIDNTTITTTNTTTNTNTTITETTIPVAETPTAAVGTPNPVNNGNGSPLPANPSPVGNGGSVCFPGHATVELESGTSVSMTDLRIGDRVRTGVNSFSAIFLFTHRDAEVHAQFVRLITASGRAVTLTKSHYLYANNLLTSAGDVRIDDVLQLADDSVSRVTSIENVSANGLYNPQTIDGNLVVDGVITSTYTTAVHPRVAHGALLAPLRFFYERVAFSIVVLERLASFISTGADKLAKIVPSGPSAFA